MQKLKNDELGRKSIVDFKNAKKLPFVIILDNIRSQNNIGSVFRTADAFLIEKIYLCGITAVPPNREIQKTALGATESVEWQYVEDANNIIPQLKKEGYVIISLEQAKNSQKLGDYKLDSEKKYALVFGNEVKGVQQEIINVSDLVVEIPQFGTKHSFNIVVSAGIVLWDFYLQLKPYL